MPEPDPELIENLLEEFVQRLRRGQSPSIADYEAAHPECAEQIRELFRQSRPWNRLPCAASKMAIRRSLRSRDADTTRRLSHRPRDRPWRYGNRLRSRAGNVVPACRGQGPAPIGAAQSRCAQRFEREARTAAQLHHTNIVPVFGVGEHQGFHYIVMQLIHGVGLDRILAQHQLPPTTALAHTEENKLVDSHNRQTAVSSQTAVIRDLLASGSQYWQNVARIGLQAANALGYAHQRGTLHRDIKPANLLIDEQRIVWITDFGLAKAMEHDEVSQTGDIVGTLRYMAPERLKGEADGRSDIYSLGLTLYELLTLRSAYGTPTPAS